MISDFWFLISVSFYILFLFLISFHMIINSVLWDYSCCSCSPKCLQIIILIRIWFVILLMNDSIFLNNTQRIEYKIWFNSSWSQFLRTLHVVWKTWLSVWHDFVWKLKKRKNKKKIKNCFIFGRDKLFPFVWELFESGMSKHVGFFFISNLISFFFQ